MGNSPGRISERRLGSLPSGKAPIFDTGGTRLDPFCQWKAALVDDLLDQAIRTLQETDTPCPILSKARRLDGTVDRRAFFTALDQELRQKRVNDLTGLRVAGFCIRILALFGNRYPYLVELVKSRVGQDLDRVKVIQEHDLLLASKCWPSRLESIARDADGRRRVTVHLTREQEVKRRAVQGRCVSQRSGTATEAPKPQDAVTWLRETLSNHVSPQILEPFLYNGRLVDGPGIVLSQAKIHFLSEYTGSSEPFSPDPNYKDFSLEEYLDQLILSGAYDDGCVSLKDILEVRNLLAAQQLARERESNTIGSSNVDAALLKRIIRRTTQPTETLHREQRTIPFELELCDTSLKRTTRWDYQPLISYRLPSPRRPTQNKDGGGEATTETASFRHTINNIQALNVTLQVADQAASGTHSSEGSKQPRAGLTNPGFPELLHRQLDLTQQELRAFTKLAQNLRRAMRIAPRKCMDEMVECLDLGLAGDTWQGKKSLTFRDDELVQSSPSSKRSTESQLRPLREAETQWLEFIVGPKDPTALADVEGTTDRDLILLSRVARIASSRDSTRSAILDQDEPVKLTSFNTVLNEHISGPVKKIRVDIAYGNGLRKLQAKKLIRISSDTRNLVKLGRIQPESYPEQQVLWNSKKEKRRLSSRDYECNLPTRAEPNMEKGKDEEDCERTTNFYGCLGFRLGVTIRQLAETLKARVALEQKAGTFPTLSLNYFEVSEGSLDGVKALKKVIRELSRIQDVASEDNDRHPPPREQLWTFGHPMNRPQALQFFNINRWPHRGTADSPNRTRGLLAAVGKTTTKGGIDGGSSYSRSDNIARTMRTTTTANKSSQEKRDNDGHERIEPTQRTVAQREPTAGEPNREEISQQQASDIFQSQSIIQTGQDEGVWKYVQPRFEKTVKVMETRYEGQPWGSAVRFDRMQRMRLIHQRLVEAPFEKESIEETKEAESKKASARDFSGDKFSRKRKRDDLFHLSTPSFVPESRPAEMQAVSGERKSKRRRLV